MRPWIPLVVFALASCRSPAPTSPSDEKNDSEAGTGDGTAGEESTPEGDGQGGATHATEKNVSVSVSVDDGAPKPDPDDVELQLDLRRYVNWGYGCGGNCASNTDGSSALALLCLKDGSARVSDAGEETHTMNFPDGSTSEKTAWSRVWTGECERHGSVLVLEVERIADVCVRISEMSDGEKVEDECPDTESKMLLGCRLEEVKVVEKITGPGGSDEGETVEAWVCNPDPEDLVIGGTPTPWVFGETSCIDTHFVGEPHPDTYLKPCE